MIGLRPFKKCDAKTILSWLSDEETFLFWGGYRIGSFPLSEKDFTDKYYLENGDCPEEDNFFPMTAFDREGIVGHFILRYPSRDKKILRFGWVIVDSAKRGCGYGREMLSVGLKYAFGIMCAEMVTIGVFEKNLPAYRCYLSVGFHRVENSGDSYEEVRGEKMPIIELELTKEEYEKICFQEGHE